MSYIVLARKYRPQNFDDVIGQPHITTTLRNAISQDRVAHAYLFAGPRGVGKTTTARIFAKAMNCSKGPTENPCNSCESCLEISKGSSLDILEIDGASNRGIDEIRALRENVKFSPSKGKFKIYIIDEVHMLTTDAFNALLKTLEEPPPHVKFIFATTQAHKVPATILSRCQRFDFKRITTKDVFDALKTITKSENLNISDEALNLIAKHSDGSMRDSQVILDQMASFSRKRIGIDDVTGLLGIVGDDILFGLSEAIKNKDAVKALKIIDRISNDGKDLFQLVSGLIEHFRNMAIAKIGGGLDSMIEASSEVIKRYKDESAEFSIEEILYVIYSLSNTIDFMRKTDMSRIPLEAAFVKLTRTGRLLPLNEVMERIEKIEKGYGAKSADPGVKSAVRPGLPVGQVPSQATAGAGSPRSTDSTSKTIDRSPQAAGYRPPQDGNTEIDSLVSEPKTAVSCADPDSRGSIAVQIDPERSGANLQEVVDSWASVINFIKNKKISVASYLDEGYPVGLESNVLSIGFPKECQFHKEVLETQDNRRLIEEAIKTALKLELKVALITIGSGDSAQRQRDTFSDDNSGGDPASPGEFKKKDVDPIVKTALEMFNGEVAAERSERKKTK